MTGDVATHIVEITAAARDGLLNAFNDISRDTEAILDVDMHATETHDDSEEPEEERGAGAVRARDDAPRAAEDAGAYGPRRG